MECLQGVGLFLMLSWAMSATVGPILHLLQNPRCGSARLSHPEVKWLPVDHMGLLGPVTWISGGIEVGWGLLMWVMCETQVCVSKGDPTSRLSTTVG